jgi:hypothetical protein
MLKGERVMDLVGWLWWLLSSVAFWFFRLLWFLLSGWVSTLLQITLLIGVIYFLKYGWRRAPFEIWRHTKSFGRFFWGWLRAREPVVPVHAPESAVKVVKVKEFGDINISTLLSLLMLAGLIGAAKL